MKRSKTKTGSFKKMNKRHNKKSSRKGCMCTGNEDDISAAKSYWRNLKIMVQAGVKSLNEKVLDRFNKRIKKAAQKAISLAIRLGRAIGDDLAQFKIARADFCCFFQIARVQFTL